jgi:hypothetical protein
VHKGRSKISLVSANQAKKLISSSKKYVLLLLREDQTKDETMRVKASLEGYTKENKTSFGGVSTYIHRSVPRA